MTTHLEAMLFTIKSLPSTTLFCIKYKFSTSVIPEHFIKLSGNWSSNEYQGYLSLTLTKHAHVADTTDAGLFTINTVHCLILALFGIQANYLETFLFVFI